MHTQYVCPFMLNPIYGTMRNFYLKRALIMFALMTFTGLLFGQTSCEWKLRLRDSYGDGWGSNKISLSVNGVVKFDKVTLDDGAGPLDFTFTASTGDVVKVEYFAVSWSYPDETSWELLNVNGEKVAGEGPDVYNPAGGELTLSCPVPIDLLPVALQEPKSGNSLTDQETIKVKYTNNGTDVLNGDFEVYYTIDGNEIRETVTGQEITSKGEYIHTFATKADLSAKKMHTITAGITAASEDSPDNNVTDYNIFNTEPNKILVYDHTNTSILKYTLPNITDKEDIVTSEQFDGKMLRQITYLPDGNIYALSTRDTMLQINHDTKEITSLFEVDVEEYISEWTSLKFNTKTKKLYLAGKNSTKSFIYLVDLLGETTEKIVELDGAISSMTFDNVGVLYVLDAKVDKKLYTLNIDTEEKTEITALSDDVCDYYFSSIFTDRESGDVYIINNTNSEKNKVFFVNSDTKKVYYIGMDNNTEDIRSVVTEYTEENPLYFISFASENQKESSVINQEEKTIKHKLFFGKDITKVKPQFIVPEGVTIALKDSREPVINGETVLDLTNDVVVVLSANGKTEEWTISAVVGKNHENAIETFAIANQFVDAVINNEEREVVIEMPAGTDVSALVPQFTLSTNASVKVKGRTQISGKSTVDFTKEDADVDFEMYTVIAEDGKKQEWRVIVDVVETPEKTQLSYPENEANDVPTIFTLKWDEVSGALGYKIYLGETIGDTPFATSETNKFKITDLTPNTTYKLKVVPYNNAGDCTEAEEWTFTTDAKTYIMSDATYEVTNGVFYDTGIEENYDVDEEHTMTLKSSEAGKNVKLNFSWFSTEVDTDELYVFNGLNIDAQQVEGSPFSGSEGESTKEIIANNPDGALTFYWTSDASSTRSGWKARISLHEWLTQDVALRDIEMPQSSVSLTDNESVSFDVINRGTEAVNAVDIEYVVNGDVANKQTRTVTFDTPLAVGEFTKVTIDNIDLSAEGNYNILFTAVLAGDTNAEQQEVSGSVIHAEMMSLTDVLDFTDSDTEKSKYVVISEYFAGSEISEAQSTTGNTSLAMYGTTYTGWSNVHGTTHFTKNASHAIKLNVSVDATSLSALEFGFDALLNQTSWSTNSYMRVMVNGNNVSGTIEPSKNATFKSHNFDISAYVGGIINIVVEARVKDKAETVYLDNVHFRVPKAVDAQIVSISGLRNGGNSATEQATIKVKNIGVADINKIIAECTIDGNSAAKIQSTIDLATPLSYNQETDVTLSNIDLSAIGTHNLEFNIVVENDADIDNNTKELTVVTKAVVNTFPYSEDFEADHAWDIDGASPSWEVATPAGEIINSAASGSKVFITNADGSHNEDEASFVQSPEFDFSSLTSPVLELKTWWNLDKDSDVAYIAYSTDKGASWELLGSTSTGENWYNSTWWADIESWTGDGNGEWITSKYRDMAALAGKSSVIFRVVMLADESEPSLEGFAFDDFKIYERPAVDAALTSVVKPSDMTIPATVKPTVKIRNFGSAELTTDVTLTINPGNNTFTKTVTTLASGSSEDVEFDEWQAVSGKYTLTFSINPAGDATPENNSIATEVVLDEAKMDNYYIQGAEAPVIDENAKTITIDAKESSDITAMKAVFDLTTGATATVNGVEQESGVTINDFTNPVVYLLTAPDGVSTVEWTVTVNAYKQKGNDITLFAVDGQSDDSYIGINEVFVEMPFGTDMTALVPTFELSENAKAYIGDDLQTTAVSAVDFTKGAVEYKVVSESGEEQIWTVTVDDKPNSATEIKAFTVSGSVADATINATAKTITAEVPYASDITTVNVDFELSEGAVLMVNDSEIATGSAIDFTNAVTAKIIAEDAISANEWTVTVTKATASDNNKLTALNVDGTSVNEFAADTYTYNVTLDAGTTATPDVTATAADATANVTITDATNILSDTEADRTTTVAVTAENGNKKEYKVVFYVESDETALSEIKIDGTVIDGFAADVYTYNVELPENTTATPEVTAVAVSTKAQVAVTDAADVTSDNATERTTTIVVTAENGDTQEYKVVFAVKKITDVEVDALNSVVVYPNPATDFVQIANAEGFRITIMNSTGNVVEQNVVNSDNYTVDVSNLTRGIYLIKLVNGESVRTIKITVK